MNRLFRNRLALLGLLIAASLAACDTSATIPNDAAPVSDVAVAMDTAPMGDVNVAIDTALRDNATPDTDATSCPTGTHLLGLECVTDAPRPIAPLSLGDVTQRRPTLRWALPIGVDGAAVDLCRDRACTMVIETLLVTGTSGRPTADLPAQSVVFWRLRGRVGTTTDTAYGPTWLFHVPAVSATGGIDTSFNSHLDLNGDGFDDIVVGAYGTRRGVSGELQEAGTVSVFHGSPSGVSMAAARVLEGTTSFGWFGLTVASAGDVNGDGFGDLVIGALRRSSPDDPGIGTASVYHGSASGVALTAARVLEGTLGRGAALAVICVTSAGDVNGDGFGDIVLGDRSGRASASTGTGTASVFHGSALGVSMTAARVLEGTATERLFGISATSAGDLNGDGFTDLVIGAFRTTDGRTSVGTASVFLGGTLGVSMTPARVLEASTAATELISGIFVASAGDVNGDGFADIVVGYPGGAIAVGTASVFHGSASGISMTAARVLEGTSIGDDFGESIASAGDVNGDGFADIVVGARPDPRLRRGTASVFHGSALGVSMTAAIVLVGTATERFNVHRVAGAGDVNGDGFKDLVLGYFGQTMAGQTVPRVGVFHGSASGVSMTAARVLESAGAGTSFGDSVASAGEVNGDGFGGHFVGTYRIVCRNFLRSMQSNFRQT